MKILTTTKRKAACRLGLSLVGSALFTVAYAATLNVVDNFTGTANSVKWYAYGALSAANSTAGIASTGACLTAGGTSAGSSGAATSSTAGIIPACGSGSGGATGTIPDTSGSGALRLTNTSTHQSGGIIYGGDSNGNAFSSSTGINITWTGYSYGGSGADGMSFFLLSSGSTVSPPSSLGANGGSLGYSCSQNSSNATNKTLTGMGMTGIHNGYLAIGMDEYGSFTNRSDNTATGNSFGTAGAIAIRGQGDISNDTYPNYPATGTFLSNNISNMCQNGYMLSGLLNLGTTTINDYPFYNISGGTNGVFKVPSSTPLYLGSATTRTAAKPITYQLQITPQNLLTLRYSYNGGTWTTIAKAVNISSIGGSIPSYLTFGFAASTGASTNYHEISCFQASPLTTSSSGASTNTESSQLQTGSQVYLAYYNSDNWYGGLTSNAITASSSGTVSVATTATWDASCVLTGGSCTTTGATTGSAQGSSSRTILTWNPSTAAGIPFQWANLTSTQQSALNSDSGLLAYLRGTRTNELGSGTGAYRARTSVLADIINSSPAWVGPPSKSYTSTWSDKINTSATLPENGTSATTYPTFQSNNVTRTNVVYAGANDGMLHGFRTGAYSNTTTYNTNSTNDGYELLGYVPNTVMANLSTYSNIIYSHNYYVDATPATGDVFYNNTWHTWLVGGMGTGGQGLFALDITTPSSFAESSASSIVKGEWNSSTITCVNNTSCAQDLGYTVGTPVITRFHNGSWGAVIGNGYNSSSGKAAIFIMLINPTTGAVTFYEYSTGYGPSKDPTGNSTNNGIYYVTAADLDSDNIADYIYAGDIFGNMWRFDVTSSSPAQWGVSSYSGTAQPLFSTPINTITSGGTTTKYLEPITTKPVVLTLKANSTQPRVMVYFGTGSKVPATSTSSNTYATGTQYFFGVWDWNMSGWNTLSTSAQMATTTTSPGTLSSSSLVTQSLLSTASSSSTAVTTYGSTTSNTVCWVGTTACTSGNTQYGWKFLLPYSASSTEQLIYNPQYLNGAITFNTTIPALNNVTSCTSNVDTGWSYALNPATGGNFTTSYFSNSSGTFSGVNGLVINAVQLSATGSFQVVTYNSSTYLVYQTSSGYATGNVMQINPQGTSTSGNRLTWIQLR